MLPASSLEAEGLTVPPLLGYRPATSWVHNTTSCKHSLLLLKMGEIIALNMSSWLRIINKSLSLHLVGCLYYLLQWCMVKQISNIQNFIHGTSKCFKISHQQNIIKITYRCRQLTQNIEWLTSTLCNKINKVNVSTSSHLKMETKTKQCVLFWMPILKQRAEFKNSVKKLTSNSNSNSAGIHQQCLLHLFHASRITKCSK
jgi:hypothetical protein